MTTTAQERTLPSTNEIVEIDLDLIDPNPWQPRLRSDPKALAELVENIHQLGRLLQMPMARPSPDAAGRFQLAFGHRRVDGLQVLRSRGDWGDTVTVVLADLTDAEMAYYALGENSTRRDITPAEQIRAWSRALREIEDTTIQALADRAGIARATMSKSLAILDLPDTVLEHVDDGRVTVRAARELLALRTKTHTHTDQLDMVLEDLGANMDYPDHPPDFRVTTVRAAIRALTRGTAVRARQYSRRPGDQDTSKLWRSLENVTFDVDAFIEDLPSDVHILPDGDTSGGARWTCNVQEWRRRQSAATRERNKLDGTTQEERARTERARMYGRDPDSPDRAWLAAVKRDPAVKALLGAEATKKLKTFDKLTAEQKTALGTRVQKPTWQGGSQTPKNVVALPAAAYPEGAEPKRNPDAPVPPFFDFSECARCVDGAAWATIGWGGSVQFICTNQQAYNDKKSVGVSAFVEWRAARIAEADAEDIKAAEALAATLTSHQGEIIIRAMAGFLYGRDAYVEAWPRSGRYNEREAHNKYDYYPETARAFAGGIGRELLKMHGATWEEQEEWKQFLHDFYLTPPDGFPWGRAAAYLTVWQARVVRGLGASLTPATAAEPALGTAVAEEEKSHDAVVTIDGRPAHEVLFEKLPRGGRALQLLGFVIEHARDGRGLRNRLPKTTYGDHVRGLQKHGVILDQIEVGDRGPGHGQGASQKNDGPST